MIANHPRAKKVKKGSSLFVRGFLALMLILTPILNGELIAQENEFEGEKILHLLQEPRHRTVYNDGVLYLLDVQVNPGDESFAHVHNQAILLTRISNADGWSDGVVGVNTAYATQPLTHKVSNSGPGLLRILAFVNGSTGEIAPEDDLPTGIDAEPQLENNWFRSFRLELAPGETTPVATHKQAGFVAQATEGVVHVVREDGITSELDMPGDWVWREAGVGYALTNMGDQSVAVVINEGRR